MVGKPIDMTGRVFGRLTVLSEDGRDGLGNARWKCRCACGSVVSANGRNMRRGRTQSCGCLHRERLIIGGKKNRRHGLSRSVEYRIWAGMHTRCENPKTKSYARYGARGITVCDRWKIFENFLTDMGARPSPRHTLERGDNDKGYGPDNCVWATHDVQQNNRSNNRVLVLNGASKTISQWERDLGLKHGSVWMRLRRGWSVDRALTEPIR